MKLDSVVVVIVNVKNQISTFCSSRMTDDGWEQEIYNEYEQQQEEERTRSSDHNQPEAPEPCCWAHSEQELSDFVKDAIRINSSPASPHSPSHVTPNTSQDQQTRGDALNESEMSYNLGIPSKKGRKFRTWGGVWTR